MRTLTSRRILHRWETLRTSYYFVPILMILAAAIAAIVVTVLDRHYARQIESLPGMTAVSPEGARVLLSAIASSVITVAGVVFSITIATLTQASNQFGPRLLRNFMRDTGNQIVLGTFVATFVYCVLVLREVSVADSVPILAVHGAVVLAILSIYLLVYFIHHTSFSLQAPQVAAIVWRDLRQEIDRMFPITLGHDGPPPSDPARPFPEAFYYEAVPIFAHRAGYLQAIDETMLMHLLVRHDLRCELSVRPGDFLIEGNPLMRIWPAENVAPRTAHDLQHLFMVGSHRTQEQDLEYAIHQLSEVAVRALSPSINDPYTAMNCIDWIGDALCRIAANALHTPYRYDDQGVIRIAARVTTFPGVVDAAVDVIRQYGRESVPVTIRLLEMIGSVALQVREESLRVPLRKQADIIARQAEAALPVAEDRFDVARRYRIAIDRLRGSKTLPED